MADRFPELEEEEPQASEEGLLTLRWMAWLAVALVVGVTAVVWFGGSKPAPSDTAAFADTIGGPFELTSPDGTSVTDQSLRGKPFAIFFGFTRCPDVCPTTLSRMAQLRKRMGEDGDKFEIVFVSVDPGYDKPEDIGRYVELFGTPIIGLTGTDEQLANIVDAYRVFYEKVPVEGGDYTIDHTASVYLMDRDGRLQSIISHQEDPDMALGKLQRLVS